MRRWREWLPSGAQSQTSVAWRVREGPAHCSQGSTPGRMEIGSILHQWYMACDGRIRVFAVCYSRLRAQKGACLSTTANIRWLYELCFLTLLSSMTVLSDSIHIGSMSPSSTIHLGLSLAVLARSRMMQEKSPVSVCVCVGGGGGGGG